ncbi:hypothetical protein SAMN05421507_116152 [Lentzea jiangxiensis]|uniref:Uncharacterized protein n=1 Tax=Lentzea jiangxiensis TaxID=641025 RepID=A0A1H0W0F5_9PSEU|nr:hypothetical protein SAMN05421507_116152 [Lentzea jiangxiensis]
MSSDSTDSYKATRSQRIVAGVLVTVLMLAVVATVLRMFV